MTTSGPIICGLTAGIGSKISDSKTWISTVTRGAFPKSFVYEPGKNWQGISGVSIPPSLISTGEMTNKGLGWGIDIENIALDILEKYSDSFIPSVDILQGVFLCQK